MKIIDTVFFIGILSLVLFVIMAAFTDNGWYDFGTVVPITLFLVGVAGLFIGGGLRRRYEARYHEIMNRAIALTPKEVKVELEKL